METTYPANPTFSHVLQVNGSESVANAAVYSHHATVVGEKDSSNDSNVATRGDEKKRRLCLAGILGLGSVAIVVTAIVFLGEKFWAAAGNEQLEVTPTVAPSIAGDKECLKKRIKITNICNLPELDDEGESMEIKVLVNDQHYWPKNVETDCLEEYGSSGEDSCVIPDSSLMGCFPLRNSVELPFGVGGASIGEQIKVTIYDTDFFFDDSLDIFVPRDEWYHPNLCERTDLDFSQHPSPVMINMVVDFGEPDNPCGVEEAVLISGLNDAAMALENVRLGLAEYVRGTEPTRRRLIFPLLATGFRVMAGAVSTGGRSFVKLFTRRSVGNALSTTADVSEIASLLFSIIGDDGEDSASPSYNNNEALFDKVFERFDQIDRQLDGIQVQIQEGFNEVKLVIEEEFAQQELDDWVTFRLNIKLRGDYQGYMDRGHTVLSRARYEDAFRETCTGDYSPYNIFQVIYSYSCLGCERFSGKAKNYFLETYVQLARANFETPTERVLWFRGSFGTVIIGAMTEAIYFYSVCLYRTKDECEVVDPVWDARLEEMGNALEEVVTSLGEAETKLE